MNNETLITLCRSIPNDLEIEIEIPSTPRNNVNNADDHWLRHVQLDKQRDLIELHAEYSEPFEPTEDEEGEAKMSVEQLLEKLLTFEQDLEVKIMHPYGDYF